MWYVFTLFSFLPSVLRRSDSPPVLGKVGLSGTQNKDLERQHVAKPDDLTAG